MGTFSAFHWIIVLLVIFLIFGLQYLPAIWIFRKAGWSGWLWLLMCVPFVGIIVLWVFAFAQWPNDPIRGEQSETAPTPASSP